MGKVTSPLSTANWRRPQFSHDQNIRQVKMPRKRKPSTSATEFDVTDAATHWRKPVAGVDSLHSATDPMSAGDQHILKKLDGNPSATAKCAVASAVPVASDGSKMSS
ncbi:hypothetical protein CDEST_13739 [Colletotrichum destructivum]|uniref:Uncharacterized protein n=1 Tax=Colletotrichum destructivum TaxID=34406 RepID=A0AAX4IZW1_9PEZI|nr:hypothetical protein CDEST_13739 [Colletotrichum destructivum]